MLGKIHYVSTFFDETNLIFKGFCKSYMLDYVQISQVCKFSLVIFCLKALHFIKDLLYLFVRKAVSCLRFNFLIKCLNKH